MDSVLFIPDFVREKSRAGTRYGGGDGTDRSLRYVEWVVDADPHDTTFQIEPRSVTGPVSGDVRGLELFVGVKPKGAPTR